MLLMPFGLLVLQFKPKSQRIGKRRASFFLSSALVVRLTVGSMLYNPGGFLWLYRSKWRVLFRGLMVRFAAILYRSFVLLRNLLYICSIVGVSISQRKRYLPWCNFPNVI